MQSEYIKHLKTLFYECTDIAKRKTKMYGESSIGELGQKGEFLQIHRKYCRLKKMLWENINIDTVERDTLEDTLVDMINYCAMAHYCINKKKYK